MNQTERLQQLGKISQYIEQIEHRAHMMRCRRSFKAFAEYVFGFNVQKFQNEWIEMIDKNQYSVLIAPREHGKTSLIGVGRILWELGNDPSMRIKVIGVNDEKSCDIVQAVGFNILTNPKVQDVFPWLKPDPNKRSNWSSSRLAVDRMPAEKPFNIDRHWADRDCSLEGCGIMSSGTGSRAELLVFDDPVDYRNAVQQPRMRQQVKDAFYRVWMNLLVPDGRVIYIATPWHPQDLTHELFNKPMFHGVWQKIPKTLDPIWPEMWPKERLETKMQLDRVAFAHGYFCDCTVSSEQLFPEPIVSAARIKPHKIPEDWPVVFGVDLAVGKTAQSSQSSIFVLAENPESERIAVDCWAGRVRQSDMVLKMAEMAKAWRPYKIFVEGNAYQSTLLEWIEIYLKDDPRRDMLPIETFYTGSNKQDPQLGLPGLAMAMERGMWKYFYPTGHDYNACKCPWCTFVRELIEYPGAAHDDMVMAAWLANRALGEDMTSNVRISILGQGQKFREAPMDPEATEAGAEPRIGVRIAEDDEPKENKRLRLDTEGVGLHNAFRETSCRREGFGQALSRMKQGDDS